MEIDFIIINIIYVYNIYIYLYIDILITYSADIAF